MEMFFFMKWWVETECGLLAINYSNIYYCYANFMMKDGF